MPPLDAPPGLVVVAHQGGWGEALIVAVPILGVVVLLRWVNRRARGDASGQNQTPPGVDPTEPGSGTDADRR